MALEWGWHRLPAKFHREWRPEGSVTVLSSNEEVIQGKGRHVNQERRG